MILPGTYANGFAPRDGTPLYSSLWRNCVGAWNPGLGVSGSTLRDWSGFQNNGTLVNGPTWAANQGRYALNFDGTNDYLLGSTPQSVVVNTIEFWWQPRSTITLASAEQDFLHLRQSSDWYVAFGAATALATNEYLTIRDVSGNYLTAVTDGGSITSGAMHHVLISWSAIDARYNIWLDGVQKTVGFGIGSGHARQVTINLLCVGAYYNAGAPNGFSNGIFGGLSIWSQPMHNQVSLLCSRRGIAYEMAPRRRSSAQVTTNRRRRIIIGGNR